MDTLPQRQREVQLLRWREHLSYDAVATRLGIAPRTVAVHLQRAAERLRYEGLRGRGGNYAYKALNFVDETRTVQQIRDALTAVYGPIPLAHVAEYLAALESVRVLWRR